MTVWRSLLAYVVPYVSVSIRRAVAPYLLIPYWSKMRSIVNTMDIYLMEILNGKRRALEKGDEALMHEIGEGRDVMSVLSKWHLR